MTFVVGSLAELQYWSDRFSEFGRRSDREIQESLALMGVVTCICIGFETDRGRQILVRPDCPVHFPTCQVCGR